MFGSYEGFRKLEFACLDKFGFQIFAPGDLARPPS